MTIEELIFLTQENKITKEECFNEILNKYDVLIKSLLKKHYNTHYYEDLLQECYIKVYSLIDTYSKDKGKDFVGYMVFVLIREIQRKYRYQTLVRIPEYLSTNNELNFISPYIQDKDGEDNSIFDFIPSVNVDNIGFIDLLNKLKTILNKKQLHTINLLFQGFNYTEISVIENTSNQAISDRIKRIRRILIENNIKQ